MPLPFDLNEKQDPKKLIFDQHEGLICVTHNETSNGTQLSDTIIKGIKKNNPNYIVAVDATSSMAGVKLDFKAADIWFASVQKCFGLPAGLGLMICSPYTLERARAVGERNHYNSLTFMIEMMEKWQTSFTPNVLGIYLLMRVMEKASLIGEVHEKTAKRSAAWVNFLGERKNIQHLVSNTAVQSLTVLPVKGTPESVDRIKKQAKKKGLLLGEGYGELKSSTFRIANFPALKQKEINLLMDFLEPF
jgi:phosphoserine aminotransferase